MRFNSLAPRGANPVPPSPATISRAFQLTRPAGGEPDCDGRRVSGEVVSTHSPRGGRTLIQHTAIAVGGGFNSLAPRGANQSTHGQGSYTAAFQLTRPAGGEPTSTYDKVAV